MPERIIHIIYYDDGITPPHLRARCLICNDFIDFIKKIHTSSYNAANENI